MNNSGQILTELIIAIAITAILAAIGAQLVNVSLFSTGTSQDRQTSSRLAEEVFEALRPIVFSNTTSTQGWNRIYFPPEGLGNATSSKGASNLYKVIISNNAWQIAGGTEIINLEGKEYSRFFIIENVCRDASSGNIVGIADNNLFCASGAYDPHTQKVTVTVSKSGAPDFIFSQYFNRYLNESTYQTSWSVSGCGPFSATSTQANYCSKQEQYVDTNANCVGDSACFRLKAQ